MAVDMEGATLRLATNSDTKITGVALDDILPLGYGRVMVKGYMSTDNTLRYNVLQDVYQVINKGQYLWLSSTAGYFNSTGVQLFKAVDNKIIGINV